jgi:hypothetical protein
MLNKTILAGAIVLASASVAFAGGYEQPANPINLGYGTTGVDFAQSNGKAFGGGSGKVDVGSWGNGSANAFGAGGGIGIGGGTVTAPSAVAGSSCTHDCSANGDNNGGIQAGNILPVPGGPTSGALAIAGGGGGASASTVPGGGEAWAEGSGKGYSNASGSSVLISGWSDNVQLNGNTDPNGYQGQGWGPVD